MKIFKYKKQVGTLRSVTKNLKKQGMIFGEGATLLDSMASIIPAEILKHLERNPKSGKVSRVKYPPMLQSFVLTLQFYSSKANEYKTFALTLPHLSVICTW